jgi:hypothetical protein
MKNFRSVRIQKKSVLSFSPFEVKGVIRKVARPELIVSKGTVQDQGPHPPYKTVLASSPVKELDLGVVKIFYNTERYILNNQRTVKLIDVSMCRISSNTAEILPVQCEKPIVSAAFIKFSHGGSKKKGRM